MQKRLLATAGASILLFTGCAGSFGGLGINKEELKNKTPKRSYLKKQ